MYHDKVIAWYQEHIARRQDIDGEMRAALKTHERLPAFLDRLGDEFHKIQALRRNQGKKPLKIKTLKEFTDDMTNNFIRNVQKMADSRAASEITKAQAKYEKQKIEDLEKTAAGKPSGDYEALEKEGVIFDQSRPDEQT